MTEPLQDPREQFLAQDPRELKDPLQLTPAEAKEIERVSNPHTGLKVAAGLAASYLIYRRVMARRITEEVRKAGPEVKAGPLLMIASGVWNAFVPRWVSMTTPYLVAGYLEGMRDARAGRVPDQYLEAIAKSYSEALGGHINEVSTDALISGFQAQVNRKIPPMLAARRTAEAFGVPRKGMNTLVNIWTSEDAKKFTDQVLPSVKDERARTIIANQHKLRARQIGDNEEWAARTQAKQMVWMYGQQHGVIPSTARRVWITAADEKVCPVCGPMNGKAAPVGEKFAVSGNKIWTPPTHVNCRCDVVLDLNMTEDMQDEITALLEEEAGVSKAAPGDPYDRDRTGRFARAEARQAKPKVTYKERNKELDDLLSQVNLRAVPVSAEPTDMTLERPKLVKMERLSRPTLTRATLAKPTTRGLTNSLTRSLQREMVKPELRIHLGSDLWKPQLIRPVPIDTNEGRWHVSDEVLTTLLGAEENTAYRDIGQPILLDGDVRFYAEEGRYVARDFDPAGDEGAVTLNHVIGEYWQGWISEQMEEYYDDVARNGGVMLYQDDEDESWLISPTDYMKACQDLVNGENEAGEAELFLMNARDSSIEPLSVRTGEVAQFKYLDRKLKESIPTLVQTKHEMPGVTTHVQGNLWSNPGLWTVVNIRQVNDSDIGGYHHLPYRVLEVEPESLFAQ